jgi:DNA-directed RNA polymerase subunit RPC12/RpoP
LSRQLSETEGTMARCPQCSGYLLYEPEFPETPARYKCMACGWMVSDPNFRKEQPRYFPPDSVDKRIEWQREDPGYDLYEPKSAACQLGISESFFKYSVKHDSSALVIMGWGLIACNTPALQAWWDGKNHHR